MGLLSIVYIHQGEQETVAYVPISPRRATYVRRDFSERKEKTRARRCGRSQVYPGRWARRRDSPWVPEKLTPGRK